MSKAKIMVLGSFHFNQEGIEYIDIQSNKRQNEVLEVVECLNKFKPTKVAVEWLPKYADLLDKKYEKFYKDGLIDINNVGGSNDPYGTSDIDERVMLGFRIAKQNNLTKIYPIDYMNEWLQNEALDYAKEFQPEIAQYIEQLTQEYIDTQLALLSKPIKEILIYMNSPEDYLMQHMNTFMSYNIIGSGDNYIGEDFVSSWFDRNLKIFSNIQRICEDDDRVLVIIGAGHLATLLSFIDNTENLEFVSPNIYLKD